MNRYHIRKIAILITVALQLTILPILVSAGTIEDIVHDFAPASGHIIMPIKGEILTDIDVGKGARIGDLLSVIKPGDAVIHPITGEKLASLDEVLAVLRITKVKSDYSHAEPLTGADYAIKGAMVNRFSGLRALFIDKKGNGEKLYVQLQEALNNLDWQGYLPANANQTTEILPAADLLFSYRPERLEVLDTTGRIIHSYALAATKSSNTQSTSVAAVSTVQSSSTNFVPVPTTSGLAWDDSTHDIKSKVQYHIDRSGYNFLGRIPTSTLLADFVSVDDGQLLATTDGDSVHIYQVDDKQSHILSYTPTSTEKVHALNWWRPSVDGPLFLTLSATIKIPAVYGTTEETRFKSAIFEFKANRLVPVAGNLSYLLGTFDYDGDGIRETLLGQELDLDNFFGKVRQLQLDGDAIKSSPPAVKLPLAFPVQGSVFADLSGDGSPESAFVRNGVLSILRNGKAVYLARNEMGGSLSSITYDKNPGQADALFSSVVFEASPVAADIDGDGQLELVVISSDQSALFSLGSRPNIQKSWLSVFKFQNGRFIKGTLAGALDTPIVGAHVSKDRVFIVTYNPENAGSNQKESHLWSFSLEGKP